VGSAAQELGGHWGGSGEQEGSAWSASERGVLRRSWERYWRRLPASMEDGGGVLTREEKGGSLNRQVCVGRGEARPSP
jgi:hypothetical protein